MAVVDSFEVSFNSFFAMVFRIMNNHHQVPVTATKVAVGYDGDDDTMCSIMSL